MTPDWFSDITFGHVFILLWLIGFLVMTIKFIIQWVPKVRAFYSDWDGVKTETREMRSVLERHEQREEFIVDNLMQLRKVNELKLRMEMQAPITHPLSAPVPPWLYQSDRVEGEIHEAPKE